MKNYLDVIRALNREIEGTTDRYWRDQEKTGEPGLRIALTWLERATRQFEYDHPSECYMFLERALGAIVEAMDGVSQNAEKMSECKHCGQYFSIYLACMCVGEDGTTVPGVAIKRGEKFEGSDEVYRG